VYSSLGISKESQGRVHQDGDKDTELGATCAGFGLSEEQDFSLTRTRNLWPRLQRRVYVIGSLKLSSFCFRFFYSSGSSFRLDSWCFVRSLAFARTNTPPVNSNLLYFPPSSFPSARGTDILTGTDRLLALILTCRTLPSLRVTPSPASVNAPSRPITARKCSPRYAIS
jgi:hypothetical protein